MTPRRKCSFNDELKAEFPFIENVLGGNVQCNATFTIAHGGRNDIVKHCKTQKNKKFDVAISSTKSLAAFVRKKVFNENEKKLSIMEATWTFHALQHNFSFRSNDCTSKLFKKFVNEKYACGRTKCEAIIINVFAPMVMTEIEQDLADVNFLTIFYDCSNHGSIKMCPILVRYFVPKIGVKIKLLELKSLTGETSEILCNYIHETLTRFGIQNKLTAICADNTNTNFGGAARKGQNNVFRKLENLSKTKIIGVNCAAHILNNCIQTAVETLPIDVEVIIVKIYSFFYIYSVRIEQFKKICENVDVEYKKLLGYSKTRWLTLKPALERIIYLFKPLKTYFICYNNC